MTSIKDKIKFALDEARILILGGQVLIGFGYQSVFQPGFQKLPAVSQDLQLASLAVLLVGLALVMAPAARDRLVEQGEPSDALNRFATHMIDRGLVAFALGLGVSVYVAVRIITGAGAGLAVGGFTMLLALALWYGPRFVYSPSASYVTPPGEKGAKVELKDKIDFALTEVRMVLPGAQATLGFQFVAMLTDSFERLPAGSKYIHLVSLGMTALAIILLITPAAFHRTVERGEVTERQHRVSTAFLLWAMVVLPPGITGDLLVVIRKVTGSMPLAAGVSLGMLALFYALWFGPGFAIRRKRARGGQ